MNRSDTRKQDLRDKIFPLQDYNDEEPGDKLVEKIKKNLVLSSQPNREISKSGFRKEADLSSPKLDKVEDAKEDEKQGEAEFGEEGARIGSARRAKAAARIKFICPAQPSGKEKIEGDQPRVETSSGTLKIRIPDDDPEVGMVEIDNRSHKTDGNKNESIPSSSDSMKPIASIQERRPKLSEIQALKNQPTKKLNRK
ncbi:hypothetical protein DEO72_LG5g3400 [Vigna unguiculata]|uniref:Uncharacterized protein n=1 Tax=Vigna unguiculata TaxID=3917 RepID=A0A4D6M569_VIGUN|nr:hypothetical protein DEO72_LG5g3400 [Vigna unguiculata]